MEVSIVSDELIMPSPGTPKHPETHLMSIMDQLAPSNHVPAVLFYSFGDDAVTRESHLDEIIKKRLQSLKQSLAKTLVSFYPLAGRLSEDKNSIVCSDEGACFVEATVESTLSKFLQTPELFHKLLPAAATDNIVTLVKVTRFTCGGMAIGTSISHKIVDASSLSFFLRSWAATTNDDRSEPYQISAPNFDGSTLFPPTETCYDLLGSLTPFFKRGSSATKKFVFNAEAIIALKTKASSSACKRNPSRVELVSAFIVKSIAAAVKARSGLAKPIYTSYLVNIRRRAMPSFPESWMGNFVGPAAAETGIIDEDTELSDLGIKIREEIAKTYNSEFVKSMQSEPERLWEKYRGVGEVGVDKEVEYIGFISWCNLGFYDVDFGWGNPISIATPPVFLQSSGDAYLNFVFLMDTRFRDGVEAWITLHQQEMAILEQHWKHFMASIGCFEFDRHSHG